MFDSPLDYPPFGFSTWQWSTRKQDVTDNPRDFYNTWLNFATEKDFSWMEQWNINEAPDRRVRRWATIYLDILSMRLMNLQTNGKG